MKVPLLDLKAQYSTIRAEIDAAIAEVMESQHFILGPIVERCENAIGRYSGSPYAVGVSSGSDALLACLMAETSAPRRVITTAYLLRHCGRRRASAPHRSRGHRSRQQHRRFL